MIQETDSDLIPVSVTLSSPGAEAAGAPAAKLNWASHVGAGCFSANGAVAATFTTGVGPTGSHTTIQTWLTILDKGRKVKRSLAFAQMLQGSIGLLNELRHSPNELRDVISIRTLKSHAGALGTAPAHGPLL